MKPLRHNNHILENLSNKFFNNSLPEDWFIDKPENDYGIDYITNIVVNNEVTGLNFSVQLKSKEIDTNKNTVNIQFKTSTLNFFRARLEPVMIIVYVKQDIEAYWQWFEDIEFNHEDLENKENIYLKVSKENKLTEINWNDIISKVQKHFGIKSLFESFTKLEYESLDKIEIIAWKNYLTQNFSDAIFYFKKALKIENLQDKASILHALSQSLYSMYNYEEALLYINQCLEIEESENLFLTKACILAEQGISTSNQHKLLDAKEIFRNILNTNNKFTYHYNYANTLSNLQEFEEAIKHYKLSLKLNPNYAEAWKNLGTAYYYLGNHEEELVCYDKALEINPNLVEALFSKGVTLLNIFKDYTSAKELMYKSIESGEESLIKNFPRGYYALSLVNYRLNNISEALKFIDKGLDAIPNDGYLINLKLDIIDSKINEKIIEESYLNKFFELLLRFEDIRAIYYITLINNYSDNQILQLLQKYIYIFRFITLDNLEDSKISLKENLSFLKYYSYYQEYRSKCSIFSYYEHLDYDQFKINESFLPLLELTFAFSYCEALDYILNNENSENKNVIKILHKELLKSINLINILIPLSHPTFSKEEKINILSQTIIEYKMILFREISRQHGFLCGSFGLTKIGVEDLMPEKFSDEIIESIIKVANSKLHLLSEK
ncbi:Tetratricopeptide repeat-containing protein [Chryseobacterium wanjuense]|uniref:Tetratricopeptide repeat-containing protein n=1 Tax=Chryseobacterium wanjuense TaxID=356305 RepID=A0A1I0PAW6_9FLAO|nr:tetratricopeptide repeat protein [Chryseobacterium wanjuense]SEW11374.1 Tetratricopeptide repeat-containing protein [Chryseobacterium wanjuense]